MMIRQRLMQYRANFMLHFFTLRCGVHAYLNSVLLLC
jgi:hypothetical protein